MLNTPVLFLVFNRPDTTSQVFDQIRKVQPKQLFIAADGPRADKEGEKETCEQVRRMVLDNIEWKCEVRTLFRDTNLGCGKAVSRAIDWFFDHVEQGIILEDDTLPDATFFIFCEQLLHYYNEKEEIMHIGGSNFEIEAAIGNTSYYFSRYNHIWGWATWRRAWHLYRFNCDQVEAQLLKEKLKKNNFTNDEINYWIQNFNFINAHEIDTWDYQWHFTMWLNEGIAIIPSKNLISNIGIGKNATHTYQVEMKTGNLQTYKIVSIKHPKTISVCRTADLRDYRVRYNTPATIANKIRNIIYKIVPDTYLQAWRHTKSLLKK